MPIMIFRYADESDVAELLGLRLRVDADQTRRFGRARWSTAIDQNSVARGLKTGRVLRKPLLPPARRKVAKVTCIADW